MFFCVCKTSEYGKSTTFHTGDSILSLYLCSPLFPQQLLLSAEHGNCQDCNKSSFNAANAAVLGCSLVSALILFHRKYAKSCLVLKTWSYLSPTRQSLTFTPKMCEHIVTKLQLQGQFYCLAKFIYIWVFLLLLYRMLKITIQNNDQSHLYKYIYTSMSVCSF